MNKINYTNKAKALINPGIRKQLEEITDDSFIREQVFILTQEVISATCAVYPYQEAEDWTDKAIEWGARLAATLIAIVIIGTIVSFFV